VVDSGAVRSIEVEALAGVLSPDERSIAFVTTDSLRTVGVDGGGERSLARLGAGDEVESLAFSPDGARIAFIRVTRRADDMTGSLEVVEAGGGGARVLHESRRLLQTGGMTGLAWRDEAHLVFGYFGPIEEPPHAELYELSLEPGARPARLHSFGAAGITDLHPTPAGLLLLELEAQADVMVAAVTEDGTLGPPRRLTESDRNDRPGDLSADGRVALTSDRHGPWDLMVQGLEDARARRLTRGPTLDTYPRFDATGALVFFRLGLGDGASIASARVMRLGADAEEPTPLFETRVEPSLRPGGRPPPEAARLRCGAHGCLLSRIEGDELVFERFDPSAPHPTPEPALRLPRPASYHDWDLTDDGATLALVEGGTDVTILELDHPDERRVLAPFQTGRLLSVVWDGDRSVIVAALHVDGDRYSIHRITLDGAATTMLRSTHTYFAHPVPSDDGARLVFAQQNYDIDVWRLEGLSPR